VIIPTYNEIENIREIITTVLRLETSFDILIIDDGSPDGTAEVVKELQETYLERLHLISREGKLGLGTAYITGFRYAIANQYDYVYEMDADFSHNPADLENLYKACLDQNGDMAVGSRYVRGVNVVNWPMGRVLMSYFASIYVRLVTGLPVHDTTAGFKCYHRSVLETIDPDKIHFIGYAFQIEMKFNAWKHGFKIVEVPIIFTDRTKGESKMSRGIFREAIFGVIEMKVKSLFRKYEPAYINRNESLESVEYAK
jgi:dolichol-phosphate mannosyltransferase